MYDKYEPSAAALNAICPYFTMFPLDFPYDILATHAKAGEWVVDPFCGRGTTNYASRLLGLPSVGIDSSPVAVGLAQAKLANTTPGAIVRAAERILREIPSPSDKPDGEFWQWAYHEEVLLVLCRLREGLFRDCRSDARRALRAILLGALHGPRGKSQSSYFSNQCPRTYAPKPRYALNFWKHKNLSPEPVDVLDIISRRAHRYYGREATRATGNVIQGDSREVTSYARALKGEKISWVITSPPYYGMRTYLPDQWLRLWFLGGKDSVDYSMRGQLIHNRPDAFAEQLSNVWRNLGSHCSEEAKMVIRFGAINDRKTDSLALLKRSLAETGWKVHSIKNAGSAAKGRRQAAHFSTSKTEALEELDVWANWHG